MVSSPSRFSGFFSGVEVALAALSLRLRLVASLAQLEVSDFFSSPPRLRVRRWEVGAASSTGPDSASSAFVLGRRLTGPDSEGALVKLDRSGAWNSRLAAGIVICALAALGLLESCAENSVVPPAWISDLVVLFTV